jgi:lincosamide nucleotidyltransferase A/C/D/E
MATSTEMTSSAVVELLNSLDTAGIPLWLDGGWGVDALLGRQTRPHKVLDIIVAVADVPNLQKILKSRGFAIKEGVPPSAFVLANGKGLEVDVHAVTFDSEGNGVHNMAGGKDWVFPAEAFAGWGVVEGGSVRCLSPTTQVLCHAQGYAPTEKDLRDMELLRDRFEIELPPQLRRSHE